MKIKQIILPSNIYKIILNITFEIFIMKVEKLIIYDNMRLNDNIKDF